MVASQPLRHLVHVTGALHEQHVTVFQNLRQQIVGFRRVGGINRIDGAALADAEGTTLAVAEGDALADGEGATLAEGDGDGVTLGDGDGDGEPSAEANDASGPAARQIVKSVVKSFRIPLPVLGTVPGWCRSADASACDGRASVMRCRVNAPRARADR